jgi:hypothetical protein
LRIASMQINRKFSRLEAPVSNARSCGLSSKLIGACKHVSKLNSSLLLSEVNQRFLKEQQNQSHREVLTAFRRDKDGGEILNFDYPVNDGEGDTTG